MKTLFVFSAMVITLSGCLQKSSSGVLERRTPRVKHTQLIWVNSAQDEGGASTRHKQVVSLAELILPIQPRTPTSICYEGDAKLACGLLEKMSKQSEKEAKAGKRTSAKLSKCDVNEESLSVKVETTRGFGPISSTQFEVEACDVNEIDAQVIEDKS
jgi:hypothetical protein